MFSHMLIPLDGSAAAESVFPLARCLSRKYGVKITLLHLPEQHPPRSVHGGRHLHEAAEAEDYLQQVVSREFRDISDVSVHVHQQAAEDVARGIVEHITEIGPDLIAMCIHGTHPIGRILFGSLAASVFQKGRVPVLVVPASESERKTEIGPMEICFQNLLIPWDGEPDHEQGVRIGMQIAKSGGCRVEVLVVVPTPDTVPEEGYASRSFLPGTTRALLDLSEEEMRGRLRGLAERAAGEACEFTFNVVRGQPFREILDAAARSNPDLVILGSHGKRGLDAFWEGSVGARLVDKLRYPMLLVPLS